jgi:hypothetical protein
LTVRPALEKAWLPAVWSGRNDVHDPADFLPCHQFRDDRQGLVGRRGTCVDHDDADFADLHGDVRAGANDEIDVALHVDGTHLARLQMRFLLVGFEAPVLRGHQRQGRCAWFPPWQQGLRTAAHALLRHACLAATPHERVLSPGRK